MFIVFLSAIVSSATHISLGNVSWIYALILIPVHGLAEKSGLTLIQNCGNAVINLLRITLIILGTRLIIISLYNVFFLECVFLIHMNIKILRGEQIKLNKHIITYNLKYVLSSS